MTDSRQRQPSGTPHDVDADESSGLPMYLEAIEVTLQGRLDFGDENFKMYKGEQAPVWMMQRIMDKFAPAGQKDEKNFCFVPISPIVNELFLQKTETAGVAEVAKKVKDLAKDPDDSQDRQKTAFKVLASAITQTALSDEQLSGDEKITVGLIGSIIEHIPAIVKTSHKKYNKRANGGGSRGMSAYELLEECKQACPEVAAIANQLAKANKKKPGNGNGTSSKKTASSSKKKNPTTRTKRGREDESEDDLAAARVFIDDEAEEGGEDSDSNWTDSESDGTDSSSGEEDDSEDEGEGADEDEEGDAFPALGMTTEECLLRSEACTTTHHWSDMANKFGSNTKAATTYYLSNPSKCPKLPPGNGCRKASYCCTTCFNKHKSLVQGIIKERNERAKQAKKK